MTGPSQPDSDSKPATLYLRCRKQDKGHWVHAAQGRNLTDWVIDALNLAALKQLGGNPESRAIQEQKD